MRTQGAISIAALAALLAIMAAVGAARAGDAQPVDRTDQKVADVPATMLPAGETYTFGEREVVADIGGAYAIGEPDAPVTIAIFGDFQCRFCARSHMATQEVREKLLREGVIRVVYLDFPLGFHDRSETAAAFARCSGRAAGAGTFWKTYGALHEMQTVWTGWSSAEGGLRRVAEAVGVPWAEVSACMGSGVEEATIERFRALGLRVGVRGTPTNFFNGAVRVGALEPELFQALVDEALRSAPGTPGASGR